MAIDWFGRWTETPNLDERQWTDYDFMAARIRREGYTPVTTMENLITMIFLHYSGELESEDKARYTDTEDTRPYPMCLMTDIEDVMAYVYDSGGLREFDYEV